MDEQLAALYGALARAQGEFPPIKKDKTAGGDSYSYTYASLDTILAAVRPALTKHGLAVTQPIVGTLLSSRLVHADGGHITSDMPIGEMEHPQAWGSRLTYARRYALTSLLGIATEDDDDGTAGARAKPKPRKKREPEPDPEPAKPAFLDSAPARPEQMESIGDLMRECGFPDDQEVRAGYVEQVIGRRPTGELTGGEADMLIDNLVKLAALDPQERLERIG